MKIQPPLITQPKQDSIKPFSTQFNTLWTWSSSKFDPKNPAAVNHQPKQASIKPFSSQYTMNSELSENPAAVNDPTEASLD